MRIFIAFIMACVAAIAPAKAADTYAQQAGTKDRPASTVAFSPVDTGIASGLYVGGSIGYGIGTQAVDFGLSDGETGIGAGLDGLSGEGVSFGLLGGYEKCFGRICAGVLGMYDWLEADTDFSVRGFGYSEKWTLGMEDLWTVAGTLGFKVGSGELFGVIGYSGADWSVRGPGVQEFADDANEVEGVRVRTSDDLKGWTFGVGGKQKIAGGLEGFLLYTYTNFDDVTVASFDSEDVGGRLTIDPDLHIVRAGVVYKFGGVDLLD